MKTLSFLYAKLILCIVAFCILTSNIAEAQSSVKVKVVDSLSGKGVEFVSVSLYEAPANSTVKYSDTDSSGRAILNNIKPGNYQLKIYHMNYFPVVKNIHVKGKVYDIGELKIKENAKRMDAVTVTAIAQAITIKKDTIEFNTAAFSVKDGDVLEQLLFKIPGLVIDKEGKMTYNGKEINKILVDGKEFMTNNPKLLQKNLPAKAIDKLKVYDKKSELAQATGVDDGNSENVLDLSVKKEFKKMLFGAVSATIGTEDKHAASIFLSKLNEKSRFGVAAYNFKNVMGAFGGFGGDNIDIVLNELDALVNIDLEKRIPKDKHTSLNIIRIGTSGALQGDLPVDSFMMSEYGLGLDGMLHFYKKSEEVCDKDIAEAFMNHCNWGANLPKPYVVKGSEILMNKLGEGFNKGITATAPGFYGPQGRQVRLELAYPDINEKIETFRYKSHRINNLEMETSALYGLGAMLGHQTLTVCVLIANRVSKQFSKDYKKPVKKLVETILERL